MGLRKLRVVTLYYKDVSLTGPNKQLGKVKENIMRLNWYKTLPSMDGIVLQLVLDMKLEIMCRRKNCKKKRKIDFDKWVLVISKKNLQMLV